MIDETKAIKAKDIVEDPDAVYGLMREYALITDSSATVTFTNMMEAIDIFSQAGWEMVNMTYSSYMFVMFKNPNFKCKNSGE